ncbi:MAG: HAD family hydrolase [Candidatus Cyclobacteriaceae bacterium M2_1C_046]
MKFLFFDCDGVLVDTEAIAAQVVTRWLNQIGCSINEQDFIARYTGKTFGSIFKELVEQGAMLESHWKEDSIIKMEHTIYEQIVAVDGIHNCLKDLEGFEKAVISNSRISMVKKALESTELNKYLDVNRIFSSEKVEKPKPDPGVYLLALKTFDLTPSGAIAIEDSLTGVQAAVKAKIKTIGFCGASHQPKGHDEKLIAAGAAAIAYNASELKKLIEELHY